MTLTPYDIAVAMVAVCAALLVYAVLQRFGR